MKRLFILFFGLLVFVPAFASNYALADTLEFPPGQNGLHGITETIDFLVCDYNPITGAVSVTTTDPGPVFVLVTGQSTGVAYRKLFYGATVFILTQSDRYDILFILPSGETYSGSFDVY